MAESGARRGRTHFRNLFCSQKDGSLLHKQSLSADTSLPTQSHGIYFSDAQFSMIEWSYTLGVNAMSPCHRDDKRNSVMDCIRSGLPLIMLIVERYDILLAAVRLARALSPKLSIFACFGRAHLRLRSISYFRHVPCLMLLALITYSHILIFQSSPSLVPSSSLTFVITMS